MILYHGTNRRFTKFSDFSFFTEDYGIAEAYADMRSSGFSGASDYRARVLQVKVDTGRVVDITAAQIRDFLGIQNHYGWQDYTSWSTIDDTVKGLLRLHGGDTARVTGLNDMGANSETTTYPQYVVRFGERVIIINETVNGEYTR